MAGILNEQLRWGDGKPHFAEFLYRKGGGETVYVRGQYPNGLTEKAHSALLTQNEKAKRYDWRTMQRDPEVSVRGWTI